MFIKEPFKILYSHRKILAALTKEDLRKKYAGSKLGLIWMFLYPLLFLLAYSFVYSVILRVRLEIMTGTEYIMMIFSGLLPFLSFTEMMGTSTSSVVINASLIKNTMVPIDIMPVKSVLTTQPTQIIGTAFLLVAISIYGIATPNILFVLPVWMFQLMFNMGIAWILSSITVFLRDVQTIVPIISLMLMFVSPIAYTVDMVPAKLQFVMNFNPLYYFIRCYQDVIVMKSAPDARVFIVMIAVSLAVFYAGYWVFSKIKNVLVDNV